MKLFIPVLLASASQPLPPPNFEIAFQSFERDFGRTYDENEDREMRKMIFKQNLIKIQKFNSDMNNNVTLGVGPFTDWTEREFEFYVAKGAMKGKKSIWGDLPRFPSETPKDKAELPTSIDWGEKGGVTAVKNQGMCGSCWSFSTTGAIEGRVFATRGSLNSISEQNLLDCDKSDNRCNGGLMDQAFVYVHNHGICSEESYPYKCSSQYSSECEGSQCTTECEKVLEPNQLLGYRDVRHSDVALQTALLDGPVSVAIEADTYVFQHYTGGVLTSVKCGHQLDHGVLCTGYGTDDGVDYWSVKNSWGERWGVHGYIKLGRGVQEWEGGECGILKMSSYPVIAHEKSIIA